MRTWIPSGYGALQVVFSLSGMTRRMSIMIGLDFTATATQVMADALHTAFRTAWGARLPTAYTFRGGTLYVGNGTGSPASFNTSTAVAGSNVNTLLFPPNVTHVCNVNTALSGRKGKGRLYIPGLKEGEVDNTGVISGAALTTYNTSLAALKSGLEGVTGVGNLYLLSHDSSATPQQVTSLTMRAKVGTQVNRVRDA